MYMYSMSPFPLLFYCFSLCLYCVESFTHLFFFSVYISFLSLSLSLSPFPSLPPSLSHSPSLPLSLPLISDTNVIKNDLTTVEKKVRREREGEREEGGRKEGECKTLINDSYYILYMYCPVHMYSYFLLLY